MNTLSWMIYAAGISGNMQGFLVAVSILSTCGIGLTSLFLAMAGSMGDAEKGSWKSPLRYVWVPLVAGMVSTLLPSQSTIYMIAASEAGEAVVTSPDAKDMLNDLKSLIQKKLKDELGDIAT